MHPPNHELAGLLETFLGGGDDRIALIEDVLFTKKDFDQSTLLTRRMFSGDDVYWVMISTDDRTQIKQAILDGVGFRATIAMSSAPATAAYARHAGDVEPILSEVVAGIEQIAVRAFDGDGYLLWTKAGQAK